MAESYFLFICRTSPLIAGGEHERENIQFSMVEREEPVVLGMCKKLLSQDFTIDYGPLVPGSSIWVCSIVCRIKI
jgi:hypothetical protein